jgi:hypothetical protein
VGSLFVYTDNKSAKFRIDHVRGGSAVLSGIFFDPAPPASAAATNFNFELDANICNAKEKVVSAEISWH